MQVGMKFNSFSSQFSLFSQELIDTNVQYEANTTTQIIYKNIINKQKQNNKQERQKIW